MAEERLVVGSRAEVRDTWSSRRNSAAADRLLVCFPFSFRLNTRVDLNLAKVTRIDLGNTRIDLTKKLTRMNPIFLKIPA